MYKKRQIASLKHRARRKKLATRRKLARGLLRGDVNIGELDGLVGAGSNGVLKTVAYLSETESITIPPLLADAVTRAMVPMTESAPSSGSHGKVARVSTRSARPSRVKPKDTAPPIVSGAHEVAPPSVVIGDDDLVSESGRVPSKSRKRTEAKRGTGTGSGEMLKGPVTESSPENAPKVRTRRPKAKAEAEVGETGNDNPGPPSRPKRIARRKPSGGASETE